MLRRMLAGGGEAADAAQQLLTMYAEGQRPGAHRGVGAAGSESLTRGPVDLFLNTLAQHGAHMDDGCLIYLPDDAPIDLRYDAVQRVKSGLVEAGARNATRQLAARRPTVQGCDEIDPVTFSALLAKASIEDKGMLRVLLAGGVWTAKFLHAADQVESPHCPFCEETVEDLDHMWYGCPTTGTSSRARTSSTKR